jgi:hypothetical protein
MGSIRHLFDGIFFDWYQGTIQARTVEFSPDTGLIEGLVPADVRSFLKSAIDYFKGTGGILDMQVDVDPRVPQYDRGVNLTMGGDQLLHVCWGGNGGGIHFVATGRVSQKVYEWISGSEYAGRYAVTRADVRCDMTDPSAWEYMRKICVRLAREYRISTSTQGDWLEGKAGRTLYIGSKTSSVRVRLYEKGIKEKSNPDWVRFEVQIRPPKKADKVRASGYSPADFIGTSRWAWDMYCTIHNEKKGMPEMEKRDVWTQDKKSVEYRIANMVKQYGKALGEVVEQVGGWDALGGYLQSVASQVASEGVPTSGLGDNPYKKAKAA